MENPNPHLQVGYGNGYGTPPASIADQPTQALDVADLADVMAPAAANVPATLAPSTHGSRMARSVLATGIVLVLLLGAAFVVLGARRSNEVALGAPTAFGASASSGSAAHSNVGRGIGADVVGSVPVDEHGNPIVLNPLGPTTTSTDAPPATDTIDPNLPVGPRTTAVPVTAPATTAPTTDPTPTTPPTTAAPTTTTTAPTPTTTSTTTPAPSVSIASFSTPASVACGADPTPYIPLSWNAPGATKVTVSIDGPGIYKTYDGPTGSDTVPFSCPGPHTYLLTAYGPGGTTVTKLVSINKTTIKIATLPTIVQVWQP